MSESLYSNIAQNVKSVKGDFILESPLNQRETKEPTWDQQHVCPKTLSDKGIEPSR
jgi:hypothetical protein